MTQKKSTPAKHATKASSRSKTSAAPSVPNSSNIAQFELANGIKVYCYENFNSPAVIVSGYLQEGAFDEPRDKAGLAGFVTDCLMRGSSQHSYEQIFESTEAVGASLSVSSGVFTTGLYSKSLVEDLPMMLDMLSNVLREPKFPARELEKERAEWLTSLQERANNTRAMAGLSFYEMTYPAAHPFHRSNDGYIDTVKTFTRADVARFHKTFFSPQDMSLVVVGAIKATEARDRIAAQFEDWRATRPARPEILPAPALKGQQRKHIAMPGKSQSTVLLGYPAASHMDSDWLACSLMNSILGQFGMYGRLGESVRKEEGLVYYIGSRFDGGMIPGPWTLNAGTNPNTIDRVVTIALAEMRRMRDKKVKPAELEDNQRYFTGVMPLQMETNEGVAGQIINMIRYKRGLDYLLSYPERVHAVTVRDIQAVAQKWLDTENFALVTAGP
jgi:zinc protease